MFQFIILIIFSNVVTSENSLEKPSGIMQKINREHKEYDEDIPTVDFSDKIPEEGSGSDSFENEEFPFIEPFVPFVEAFVPFVEWWKFLNSNDGDYQDEIRRSMQFLEEMEKDHQGRRMNNPRDGIDVEALRREILQNRIEQMNS